MSMFYEEKRPGGTALWSVGLAATFVVHGAVVFVMYLSSAQASGPRLGETPVGQFIDVQAVRFGKPRDLSFLPHKAAPVVKQPRPKLALTENERALPKPPKPDDKPEKIEADPLELLKQKGRQLATGEEGSTGSAEQEGDPNGLKGGTATVGKGPLFLQKMLAAVSNAWTVPTTISDAELEKLAATACFKMDATGHVLDFEVKKSSGDPRFDATLVEAVQSIKEFEPPPAEYKATVMNEGVCMNFNKKR